MPAYNKVFLMGHVTRDPVLKHIGSGEPVPLAEFGLAVNRKFKEKEEVTFVDCTAWGKQAETITKYVTKGKPLFIEGRLKLDTWEKDGQKRSKLSVVVENFQFLGAPDGGKGGQNEAAPVAVGADKVNEDDIPW